MKHNRFQRIFSVLILLALVTALVPLATRAEGGSLYVTGYTVEIPYEIVNGDVELNVADAFDVNM